MRYPFTCSSAVGVLSNNLLLDYKSLITTSSSRRRLNMDLLASSHWKFLFLSLPGSAILHSASYLPCNSRAPFCYAFLFGVGVRGRFQPQLDAGGGFPHPAASTLHPVDAKSESFLILVWLFIFLEARVKHFLSTHTNESICP